MVVCIVCTKLHAIVLILFQINITFNVDCSPLKIVTVTDVALEIYADICVKVTLEFPLASSYVMFSGFTSALGCEYDGVPTTPTICCLLILPMNINRICCEPSTIGSEHMSGKQTIFTYRVLFYNENPTRVALHDTRYTYCANKSHETERSDDFGLLYTFIHI